MHAAFTREAIRDFYDLDRFYEGGADLSSAPFIELVDAKLAELGAPPDGEAGGVFRAFRKTATASRSGS